MKNRNFLLSLVTFLSVTQLAQALDLKVVKNYNEAGAQAIWEKVKPDVVPEMLMSRESVTNPGNAYGHLFPKTFLQEDMFVVCHDDCSKKEILKVNGNEIQNSNDWNIVEQSNVYFWLNQYFKFLERELGFRPEHHLRVMTNRNYSDVMSGDAQKNNAFFMPSDMSLSFLPASKSILFKLLQGKINRSGYDASVIVHEASHYIFHHLFPHAVNDEIGGLNEGFADYFASAFLQNPKIGMVMLRGKAMRDASTPVDGSGKFKSYAPKMEVHDLGERVTYALWSARENSDDKREMDRLVIDAVIDLARNPYSSVHDFKEKMLERLPSVVSSHKLSETEAVFEKVFEGRSNKVTNLNFLSAKIDTQDFIGFTNRQILTSEIAKTVGMKELTETSVGIISVKALNENQTAVLLSDESKTLSTPYWVVVDKARDNILAAYTFDNQLVKDSNDIEKISSLLEQAKNASSFKKTFNETVQGLADLSLGKGELGFFYKVKNQNVIPANLVLNGQSYPGQKIEIFPKRKLLTGVILGSLIGGLPPIKKATIYTIPENKLPFPAMNAQKIIGYRLTLESGIETEVMLDNITLK